MYSFTELHDPTHDAPPLSSDPENNKALYLKGIALIANTEDLLENDELESVCGLKTVGISLPGSYNKLMNELSKYYNEVPLDKENIAEIKSAIYRFYEQNDQPFISINVPPQKISTKVLQLVVTEAHIGEVKADTPPRGNFERIQNQFDRTKDGKLDLTNVRETVKFLNRNPFQNVQIVFEPGEQLGSVDLRLLVENRFPFRLYAGADNTGLLRTHRQRVTSGLNARGLREEDFLAFQYTTSYEPKKFQGYTGQYIMLLPWKNILTAYGGYSRLHADLPFPSTTNVGTSSQVSLRYIMPVELSQSWESEYTVGCDYKGTNTTIFFQETDPQFTKTVNLSQFTLKSRFVFKRPFGQIIMEGEVLFSPGVILPNSSQPDFNQLRTGADNRYAYGKGSLEYTQLIPSGMSLNFLCQGQAASGALLPSEQQGIGGHDTVRGYDERQLNMDNALIANFEIKSPSVQIISRLRKTDISDSLYFLGFFDYGWGHNLAPVGEDARTAFLMSAGPGIRYLLPPYISARLDWGWKLEKKPGYTGGASMVHFGVNLSY